MGARVLRLRVCLAIASLALAGAGSDLYKTLGVKREDATPKTIKAAYKKAALRFHPDRQVGKDAKTQKAAEAKFKEAARAYEVLSDAEKRKVYDRFGDDGLKAKEQGADMSGPFAGAYGGGGGGYGGAPAGFGGGFSPFGSGGGVSFGSFPGGVRFSTGGSGSSAAGLDDLLGMLFGQRPTGGGGFGGGGFGGGGFGDGVPDGGARARKAAKPIEVSCSLAQVYAGCTKKLKLTLRGVTTYVTVTVPPGARAGAELIAQAADGDEAPPAGVRFVLRELPHPWLERAGDDLIWRCALSHEQATAKKGVRLKIKTLDGRELTVSTRALRVRDGARHVLRGEGMPVGAGKGGAAKQRGDLIIVFDTCIS